MSSSEIKADLELEDTLLTRVIEHARRTGMTPGDVLARGMEAFVRSLGGRASALHGESNRRTMCERPGRTDSRALAGGREARIVRFAFMPAIFASMTSNDHSDLWCYATRGRMRCARSMGRRGE